MMRLCRSMATANAHIRHVARLFSTSSMLWGRTIPYKLADIGEGIREVQVLKVCVKPGDVLREFDNICEVQSDKATVDITSRYSGVVKNVHVQTGAVAQVGEALIDIEIADENSSGSVETSLVQADPSPSSLSPPTTQNAIPVKLTDIGEGIREVQVLQVAVKAGDRINEMDKICEVQSDKATVDITSRYTGTVKAVHVTAGTQTLVGDVLIDIIPDDLEQQAAPAVAAPSSLAADKQPSLRPVVSAAAAGKALATPATRYQARLHNVDISLVPATGKGGRVTKDDILRYVSLAKAQSPSACTTTTTAAAANHVAITHDGIVTEAGDTVIPITGVRRGMVKTMTQAASIPTFSFSEEYELSALMALRNTLKESVLRRSDGKVRLSFMPFFLKACSMALTEFPDINAHCPADCSALIRKKAHHIGFAMDTPNGLIVPVVRDVEKKSVFELAQDLDALIDKGKRNRLTTADMTGGTFTISNIGAIGATYTSPVILPPQVGIAAMGRLQTLPRFNDKGDVTKANIMIISFTADHRVIDGATMVRFANAWKRYLEQPGDMVLDLK